MNFGRDQGGAADEPLAAQVSHAQWRPIAPPRRGERDRRSFYVSMLMPGFSNAYHRAVLRRGYTSIRKYRLEAEAAAHADPELVTLAHAAVTKFSPADGMLMAQFRNGCQLPFWSKLAIVEYRKRGHTIPAVAQAFHCSPRTIVNVTRNTVFVMPQRRLTYFQQNPPSKIASKGRVIQPVSSKNGR
jgi:hypothetical protein